MVSRSLRASALLACALGGCSPRVPFGDDRKAVEDERPAQAGAPAAMQPQAPLDDLPVGSARSLGRYECTDLAGGGYPCQSIEDYSRFVYDRSGQQLLWFGGGNHATSRTDVAVLKLDTLRWESAYEPTPCREMVPENADIVRGAWRSTGHPMSRQTFDMLVMADRTQELVMLTYNAPASDCEAWPADAPNLDHVPGRVAHYAPTTRSWRFSDVPSDTWPMDAAAEYDPETGLVLVLGPQDVWTYDPAAGIAAHRFHFELGPRIGYAAELVYFPPTGRFYYFTRTGLLFELELDRSSWEASTISEITDATGTLPAADAKGWAYDPVHRTIAGGVRDSVFYEFEPESHVWRATTLVSETGERPGNVAFFTLDYADEAGVFLFFTDYDSGWQTWSYRN